MSETRLDNNLEDNSVDNRTRATDVETANEPESRPHVESELQETKSEQGPKTMFAWIITVVIIGLVAIIGTAWIVSWGSAAGGETAKEEHKEEPGHSENETGQEVKLDPEALESADLEYETVTQRPAIALLNVTGTVESNPQQMQSVTPLVGGRIENIYVVVGDHVARGQTLAVIASPQVAQMHGKLHEAETALDIAERNYSRVQKAENRVAVLQAKAKLDEAEATLKRTRRLIELGAGAGKDLIAAETAYKTAKAEYDFQSNISLNRDIQEARAAVDTAKVDVKHIRDEMIALGVDMSEHDRDKGHRRYGALISVTAPAAGMITERLVNAGTGIEAGKTLLTISNLSTIWVIANVPEAQLPLVRIGTLAEIGSPALGEEKLSAHVSYIDPQLNEGTRTDKVRLDVPNPNGRLRAGMFTEVGFRTGTDEATGEELVVKSEAIQRTGEKTVVFVPKDDEPGAFEVREVEIGAEIDGYTRIISGLELGEKVVTKGSFTLKTQLEKGAMGDDHH